MDHSRPTIVDCDNLTTLSPVPIPSSSSSATIQSEYDEETPSQEQHEEEEFHYVSNKVREYHSLLLQASDALCEDADSCREYCYYLLSHTGLPRVVRCGALFLLAACSKAESGEALECLEEALMLCDEMAEVNEKEGVSDGMVPHKRAQAMREQLFKLKDGTTPFHAVIPGRASHINSTTDDTPQPQTKKRVRLLIPPPTIEDKVNDSNNSTASSSDSFTTAPLSNIEDQRVPHIDRCHIAEMEFELSHAREEESKAKRRVHQARKKREIIEERLTRLRRLRDLQKM